MASYLAEKICPLTPSQKPTNISHLVQRNQQMSPPQVSHVQCSSPPQFLVFSAISVIYKIVNISIERDKFTVLSITDNAN